MCVARTLPGEKGGFDDLSLFFCFDASSESTDVERIFVGVRAAA